MQENYLYPKLQNRHLRPREFSWLAQSGAGQKDRFMKQMFRGPVLGRGCKSQTEGASALHWAVAPLMKPIYLHRPSPRPCPS